MGMEEGEDVQAKGICTIFNKIKFPTFWERVVYWGTGSQTEHQTDVTKIELLHGLLLLKQHAQGTDKEYWSL
jgi:hypothetical protein